MSNSASQQARNAKILQTTKVVMVTILWSLPAWLVWRVFSQPELQLGLSEGQIGILLWYPLIAVLMLFFALVLYRRLPKTWLGFCGYLVSTVVLPGLHYYLSKVTSLTILIAEWATFSLTLFVLGFTIELLRRMSIMARKGYWKLVVFGGLANVMLFVLPGILISNSLYHVLYVQGLFQGGLLLQIPYVLATVIAIKREWQSFHSM